MMIKYRVHEVAKDLGLPNKEVIDTLQKYTGETKKHMTALTENELDVVFEEFTQKNRVESFDEYFADQKEPAVTVTVEQEPAAPQKPAAPARPAQPQQGGNQPAQAKAPQQNGAQGQQGNAPRRPAVKPGKITPVRPAPQQNGNQPAQTRAPQQGGAQGQQGNAPRRPAVKPGKITRTADIRVVRDGIVIAEDKVSSLKRFKDDVKEVADGYDFGMTLEKFNDVKEGDVLEAFTMEEYKED